MKEYTLLVLSNARSGRDDEFNEWYSGEHVPAVLNMPEFISAQRFRHTWGPGSEADAPSWRYMTLYTVRTDDMPELMARMFGMLGTEAMPLSDSADADGIFVMAGEPM